jgi:hypothetical protein
MTNNQIEKIIDKHLQNWIDKGLNKLPDATEPEMAKSDEPIDDEGWQTWHPITSTISDTEIQELEEQLKVKLTTQYKSFLKYKHFYELYINQARFSGQEIRTWRRHLVDMAFDRYPREFLIDKGYLPFADWSDWGLLCFNTNKPSTDNEYPIVLWDHERWEEFEEFSTDFNSLLVKLDKLSNNNGS